MKLIIDIPDEDYKFIKDLQFYNSGRRSGKTIEQNVINGIKNGKPYEERPTGHWVKRGFYEYCPFCNCMKWNYSMDFCGSCGADMQELNDKQ